MCLETEAIRAMFRRSSATVPTGSTSAVNCVWTVASRAGPSASQKRAEFSFDARPAVVPVNLRFSSGAGAAAYEAVEAFHDSVRMLIGGFALSAQDDALGFEVEGHRAEGGQYVGADEALNFAVASGGQGVGAAGGGHCGQFDGADPGVVENDWLHAGGAGHPILVVAPTFFSAEELASLLSKSVTAAPVSMRKPPRLPWTLTSAMTLTPPAVRCAAMGNDWPPVGAGCPRSSWRS